ncbi:hypothetical protein VTG60DRAFT_5066 [Thermothelomyces hinnuleus]
MDDDGASSSNADGKRQAPVRWIAVWAARPEINHSTDSAAFSQGARVNNGRGRRRPLWETFQVNHFADVACTPVDFVPRHQYISQSSRRGTWPLPALPLGIGRPGRLGLFHRRRTYPPRRYVVIGGPNIPSRRLKQNINTEIPGGGAGVGRGLS